MQLPITTPCFNLKTWEADRQPTLTVLMQNTEVVRLCFKRGNIGISLHFGSQSVALPTSTLCLGPTRAHHETVGGQGDKSGLPGHCLNALIFSPAWHGELEPQSKHNPQDMQPYCSGADLQVNKTVVRLQYSSEAWKMAEGESKGRGDHSYACMLGCVCVYVFQY